jgi:2-hydroxy-3-oxopropionate reductase
MTTVAFIGLGTMGAPMARNLINAGHDVIGFNRSAPAMRALEADGGRVASSVSEAVAGASVAITMLPDTPDVRKVALGDDGIFAGLGESGLYIDMSTIQPSASRELAQVGAQHGIAVLDAPVSGGEQGARDGSLSIMVGGEDAAFHAAATLFQSIGTTIVHVGAAGAGQIVKAANQLIVAGNMVLLAEAVIFLEAQGLDVIDALRVLGGGLAGSTVLARKGEKMVHRDFTAAFRAELHHKDLGIGTQAARDAGVVLPMSGVAAQVMASVVARGDGSADHSAVFTVIQELSGRGIT